MKTNILLSDIVSFNTKTRSEATKHLLLSFAEPRGAKQREAFIILPSPRGEKRRLMNSDSLRSQTTRGGPYGVFENGRSATRSIYNSPSLCSLASLFRKKTRKRKKWDYSKNKFLVGELLSVAMRGGGHKGVLRTILSYSTCEMNE